MSTVALDGTLVPSFGFADTASYSGKYHHTGVKLSLLVESQGVPLSLQVAPGAAHDLPLAEPTVTALPNNLRRQVKELLADTAYDAAAFRIFLRQQHIEGHIPKRSWPKPALPHPPQLTRRFVVERTHGWNKSFRRLRFRYDYSLCSFLGFVLLALVVICIRKLLP